MAAVRDQARYRVAHELGRFHRAERPIRRRIAFMSDASVELLQQLRPTTKTNVIDLLRHVGHDVALWSIKADGTPVATPAANPSFCYDWAFGSEREGVVLCVWYQSLQPIGDHLEYRENLRSLGDRLSGVAASVGRSPTERNRARQQAARALHFDSLVRIAFNHLLPIWFIVNDGNRADRERLGEGSSHVWTRALDLERWYVHEYDDSSGDARIVRALKPTRDSADDSVSVDEDRGRDDKRQLAAIKVRRGQPEFRERLLAAWERKCVVTGCRVVGLLEAAHITPHGEGVDYRTSNGLLLRADIHTLYDLGLLSIDQYMRIHLAGELQYSEYRQYGGKQIDRRPARSADAPSHEALAKRHAAFLDKEQRQR